jgi:hypothetical protein
VSPVEASTAILVHLRDAWNDTLAAGHDEWRLERQAIVLTVPASFDEEARELTLEAARAAGLGEPTLLEEPLAAFYAWLSVVSRGFPGLSEVQGSPVFADGDLVLVCDVGGGTTDFSLIRVERRASTFERTAVGEHLLLGGDNLDLALARHLESRLGPPSLTLVQRLALRRSAASAKERLLSDPALDRVDITVLGSGRTVVGGTRKVEARREDVLRLLLDGFLPLVDGDAEPARDRHSALREMGLPYADDPAITRHLAAFLRSAAAPSAVLFNGGFFTPAIARERILENLARWHGGGGSWKPRVLENPNPAAAVALGAAAYALAKRGEGPRVRAGSARSYYVGLGGPDAGRAVCILPRGTEEGATLDLSGRNFLVSANRPVVFPLYSSTTRADALGAVIGVEESALHLHAPLSTVLRFGRKRHVELEVGLSATYTETGTLQVECASRTTEHRWRLRFFTRDVQSRAMTAESGFGRIQDRAQPNAAPGEGAETSEADVPEDRLAAAKRAIEDVFGPSSATSDARPQDLPARLETTIGFGKHAWPLGVIRALADTLLAVASGRRRSARHEARWLNLAGFCLRPGFGAPLDDWRVGETRTLYMEGLAFASDVQCQAEWIVLWQRIAGGLQAGQQHELYQRYATVVDVRAGRRAPRVNAQVQREAWRLLASLERLAAGERVKLGETLLARLEKEPTNSAYLWSIGRLGARTPAYGAVTAVVPATRAEAWLERLLSRKALSTEAAAAAVEIGGRCDDPLRDISEEARARAMEPLAAAGFPEEAASMERIRARDSRPSVQVFGEALPAGLRLAGEPTKGSGD